ncbi:MAG: tetratricopeptide repeat protein [Pseudomonadota bacterium]
MLWQRSISLALVALAAGCAMPGGGSIPTPPAEQPVVAEKAAAGEVPTTGTSIPPMTDATLAAPEVVEAYNRGVFLLETGDQTGAESAFKQFMARHPGYSGPHVNLAIIYQAQGRLDEAQTAIDTALSLNPGSAPALNQQGILHRKNGRFADAEAAYLKAVTVSPEYPLAHLNLGILNELYLGRLAEALESYQTYQALTPDEDPNVARWITDLTRRTARN